MLIFLIILNFAISIFNSWAVGRNWAETKSAGGWPRFITWCGAVMAAMGFTWCYTIIAGIIAHTTGYLTAPYVEGLYRLGYLIVILPILGSGIGITIESWAYFWRRRTFGGAVGAGWNSFAQIYNVVGSMKAIPESLGFLADLYKSSKDEKDNIMIRLMIVLAIVAFIGGILTAAILIRSTACRTATYRSWGLESMLNERKAVAR